MTGCSAPSTKTVKLLGPAEPPAHRAAKALHVPQARAAPRFSILREREFGSVGDDSRLVPLILEAAGAIREAYRPFAPKSESRQASDTLVTKIVLGTFGCLPACDRYFLDGWKSAGLPYSYLNSRFVERILRFCRDHLAEFRDEQAQIERERSVRYPLMKLLDMHFWESGYELENHKSP